MNLTFDAMTIVQMLGAAFLALGGKELISMLVKRHVEVKRLREQQQQQHESQQFRHDIDTSSTLIQQLRQQNEGMSTWFMEFAGNELRTASSEIAATKQRVHEVYIQLDVLQRELQGLTQEVIEFRHAITSDVHTAIETELEVFVKDKLFLTLSEQLDALTTRNGTNDDC